MLTKTFVVARLKKLRNVLIRMTARIPNPLGRVLVKCLMSKKSRATMDRFGPAIAESVKEFESLHAQLIDISPVCAQWLNNENYSLLHPEILSGGMLIVMDALHAMHNAVGSLEIMAEHFDRYVTDLATFRALIMTFFSVPLRLKHQGYNELERLDDTVGVFMTDTVKVIWTDEIANELIAAKPGKWKHDHLVKELRMLWPEYY